MCATSLPAIAQDADSSKVIWTNIKSFTVPFKIDNSRRNYIEVQLYLSTDSGKTWKFYEKQDVSGTGFRFNSQGDGEYWFALKTLDRDRQLVPSGRITRPELRIIVDTKEPQIELDIDSDAAGRAITSWRINDEFLDPASIRISHRGAPANGSQEQWLPVEFNLNPSNPNRRTSMVDRIAWWPQTLAKRVEVKVEVADEAGNKSEKIGFISLPNVASRRSNNSSTTSQFQNPASGAWTKRTAPKQTAQNSKPNNVICENGVCRLVDTPRSGQSVGSNTKANPNTFLPHTRRFAAAKPAGSATEYIAPPVPTGYSPLNSTAPQNAAAKQPSNDSIVWKSDAGGWSGQNRIDNASTLQQNDFPIKSPAKTVMGANSRFDNLPVVAKQQQPTAANRSQKSITKKDNLVVSESTTFGNGKAKSARRDFSAEPVSQPSQVKQPGEAFAKTQQFQQISTTMPKPFIAPVANQQIQKLSVNTRRFNLSYDVQAIDPSGVGKVVLWVTKDHGLAWEAMAVDPDNTSPFPVEIQADGNYGFKVVINSRDGITGKPPVSGDQPDVWVQVDLTIPQVALTSAPYGSGDDIGKLIIHWEAFDEFMVERPIHLSYSPNPSGPWTTIQDRLRNTGTYAWKVPAQVPQEIFLRLTAKDDAGNVGIYQLTSPIDISGLVPRGRIYGVEPLR